MPKPYALTDAAKNNPNFSGVRGGSVGIPPTPAPVAAPAAPINRTIIEPQAAPGAQPSPYYASAETFLDQQFKAPETREQIAERKRRDSQALIDSIDKNFNDEIERKKQIGNERLGLDNALSVITGNTGGSEAIHSKKSVTDANEKEIQEVNNRRALEIGSILRTISKEADDEAREQLQDATRSAEAVVARRKESQARSMENLKLMATSGLVDFDAFKSAPENSKVYQHALDSVDGSEEALKAVFMINRPQDQLIGQPMRIGDKFVQAYQHPISGKVTYEQLALPFDLPPEYNNFQKMGDNLVAIPDGWDGDVTKLRTVAGQKSTMDLLQEESARMDIALKGKALNAPPEIDKDAVKEEKAAAQGRTNAQSAYDAVTSLLSSSGKSKAVGVKGLTNYLPGTAAQSFKADLERTKALLTLPALQQMKGLGAMSDREFATLSSSAAALNTSMSEADFDKELRRIQTALQSTIAAGSQNTVIAPDGQEVVIID